jgi:hypothetical protein
MGVEFLSLQEFEELVARAGGTLKLPERVEDPANFRLSPA